MDIQSNYGEKVFAGRLKRLGDRVDNDSVGSKSVEGIPDTMQQETKETRKKRFTSDMKGLDVERTPVTGSKATGLRDGGTMVLEERRNKI